MVRFEFKTLCDQAETIAHVQCLESWEEWDTKSGTIFTFTRLKVLKSLKGNQVEEILLKLPGGRLDGQRMRIHGIPQFKLEEETVVFLSRPGESGLVWPIGLSQGCYLVRLHDEEERYIQLSPGFRPFSKGYRVKPVNERFFQIPLPDFLDKIQQALASPSVN